MGDLKEMVEGRECACGGNIRKTTRAIYGTSNVYGPASFKAAQTVVGTKIGYKCMFCGCVFEPTDNGNVGIPQKK